MTTVGQQIRATDKVISRNIGALSDERGLLSQNILGQLRNLVEGVAVLLESGSWDAAFDYMAIESGLEFISKRGQYSFLVKFHKMLQVSASHYTVNEDTSERLMLKYFEYLIRIRTIVWESFKVEILSNLDAFPLNMNPSLREYYEKIAARIEIARKRKKADRPRQRYYIHKIRPFLVKGKIYYEVTFYEAVNKVNKTDRIIAFTDIDITDKYAAWLTLEPESITVFDRKMPILIIRNWEVSVRPCEFDNFARLLGKNIKTSTNSKEYLNLMKYLTKTSGNLLDMMEMSDVRYLQTKKYCSGSIQNPRIFPVLDEARKIIRNAAPGSIVLRYLMLRLRNDVVKSQYSNEECSLLSDLNLQYGCIPFETMPLCTSLVNHNPRYFDLIESIGFNDREHELLGRIVKTNVESRGMLYTPVSGLAQFPDISKLIYSYNKKVYKKHTNRELVYENGQVFIRGYEDDTLKIVQNIQSLAETGPLGYTDSVEKWLTEAPRGIDDESKKAALLRLFSQSQVALIYGAAGTGKSTMIDHIAQYFNSKRKLFLAHTNPAISNLKRRVTAQNATFRTIASHVNHSKNDTEFDLVIIDECSTVSNEDILRVLELTKFKLLVLVGDVYQIESIRFGNWFSIIRSFVPNSAIFELMTPYRSKNKSLLAFWNAVRSMDDHIAEKLAKNSYSTVLDDSLFTPLRDDEIILCLNYDGLYGINNINKFLQSGNPNPAFGWRASNYKVGDPVLFNDTDRFGPIIYNNLKGSITKIDLIPGRIEFDIRIDQKIAEYDVEGSNIEFVDGQTVRFTVYDNDNRSDDDIESSDTVVPFQVAYAVSIHKAQGLEFDSVKVVITDANKDDITHSIFYTAVTRARNDLRIFWTPETQQAILASLEKNKTRSKDVALLSKRRGVSTHK